MCAAKSWPFVGQTLRLEAAARVDFFAFSWGRSA
jgi:hypothetical protein